jgi:hypothetical protein
VLATDCGRDDDDDDDNMSLLLYKRSTAWFDVLSNLTSALSIPSTSSINSSGLNAFSLCLCDLECSKAIRRRFKEEAHVVCGIDVSLNKTC